MFESVVHILAYGTAAGLTAVVCGVLLARSLNAARRRLSRVACMVLLVCAAVATIKAQKRGGTLYVDAHATGNGTGLDWENAYADLNTALNAIPEHHFLPCDVYVRPGVYGPVLIDSQKFHTNYITWEVEVISVDGAETTVIDGEQADYGFTLACEGLPTFCPWVGLHGFTVKNADVGVYGIACGSSCILRDCRIGVYDSSFYQCVYFNNSECGVFITDFESECPDYGHRKEYEYAFMDSSTFVSNGVGVVGGLMWIENSIFYRNGTNYFGAGKIENCFTNGNPMFVDLAAGDLHLKMGSPCINNGWSGSTWGEDDLDGNPRIQRNGIDFGAYEFQPTSDVQTISAPIPVEFSWLDEMCPDIVAAYDGDYDRAVLDLSANAVDLRLPEPLRSYYSIWQSYLIDIDPTDSNATFRAQISLRDDCPVVTPDPESPRRKYTVLGKLHLTNDVWRADYPDARFFKVRVELP